jgi:hypothetical protein
LALWVPLVIVLVPLSWLAASVGSFGGLALIHFRK